MRMIIGLMAAGLLVVPGLTQAAPLAPTGRWVVNFDAAQCVASRSYGDAQLFLKASPLGDVVQFGIVEPGTTGPPQQVDAEIRPEGGAAFKGNALMWTARAGTPRKMRLINMPVAEFEKLSRSAAVDVQIGTLKGSYAVPGMSRMAEVMKSCVDDLQKVWSSEGGVATTAQASLASYFKDDDYPADAIRNELSGTTGFALLVNEEGRIADCMVVQTSGQAALDMQTCAILKQRARFNPAMDLAGKPTKDRVTGRIRWALPK